MKKIIVGSRDSVLAVAQSMIVVNHLKKTLPDAEIELFTMKTSGDRILDRTLDKVGGKGLFVKDVVPGFPLVHIQILRRCNC